MPDVFNHIFIQELPRRKSHEYYIARDPFYPENISKYLDSFRSLDLTNIIFLSNTKEMHEERLSRNIRSFFVNNNCFVNENVFLIKSGIPKTYDVVYNGRFSRLPKKHEWQYEHKRHYLTSDLKNMVLLDGCCWGDKLTDNNMRSHYIHQQNVEYFNRIPLSPNKVGRLLNRCRVGLILSEAEGQCRAVAEYLLCGLPVVSTPSRGGRDVWFNNYNSIICEPDPTSVKDAVNCLLANPRDPHKIRNDFLKQAWGHRIGFIQEVIKPLTARHEKQTSNSLLQLSDEKAYFKISNKINEWII